MALSKQVKARIRRNKTSLRRMPPWKRAREIEFARSFFPMKIMNPDEVGCELDVHLKKLTVDALGLPPNLVRAC